MKYICFYKKFVFVALFFISSAFGMKDLAKLSRKDAANLWRGGVLTIMHKIEIKHNHVLSRDFSEPIEFDKTGRYIRLNCVDSDKKLNYHIFYDIRNQEEIDPKIEKIDFIPCDKRWINESFECDKMSLIVSTSSSKPFIGFGFFRQDYCDDDLEEFDTVCKDIGVYDFLYKKILRLAIINRASTLKLAVNNNDTMIATNLDDGEDTIVILYPELLSFLKYKHYYDFKIGFN